MNSLTRLSTGLPGQLVDAADIREEMLEPVENFPDYRQCGIYFLAYGGDVVYVGQSQDIHSRLSAHIAQPPAAFNRFGWVPCRFDELNDLEAFYIAKYRPVGNKGLPPNSRYLTAKQARAVVKAETGKWVSPKTLSQVPSFSLPGHPQKAHLQYYDIKEVLSAVEGQK